MMRCLGRSLLIAITVMGPANGQNSAPSQADSDRCVSAADNFARLGKLKPNVRSAFIIACAGMESRAIAKLNEANIPMFVAEKCEKETIDIGGLYSDYANCQDEMLNKLSESELRRASYWELVRNGRLERLYWRASDCHAGAQPRFPIPDEPPQAAGVCISK
jgi:hypothetical protein